MTKPDWGTKRVCVSCATKFYDFARSPIVCPKCGSQFDPEIQLKSRRSRPAAVKPIKAVRKPPKRVSKDDDDDDSDSEEDIDLGDDLEDIEDDADEDAVLDDGSDLDTDDVKKVVGAAEPDEAEER